MLNQELPDDCKIELAKLLGEVGKAQRKWQRSLLVQMDGVGVYSHSTQRSRRAEFVGAVEAVNDMLSDTALPEGLLAEAER